VCNIGDHGLFREQQLIFRYDGERREIPVTENTLLKADPASFRHTRFPRYWTIPEVSRTFEKTQDMVRCEKQELQALQAMMDKTFRRILTRDRVYEYQASTNEEMPYRLEVVHAFRSENMPLWQRLLTRRAGYSGGADMVQCKTREAGDLLNQRLMDGEGYLFHGTNPSSSVSILKNGFVLNHAGKSTGTMFGYGVYLAECCSKSDEYASEDTGGAYPGLRALLVCRSFIGNPYVVHQAGDYIEEAKANGCDCLLGDRESKVNTYREFVFFDEAQVVPEYTVIYKRVYDEKAVPAAMRTRPSGTTGRNWQVKLDKGWVNVEAKANRLLLEAMKRGESRVEVSISDFPYIFDLERKEQTNVTMGTVRQLRPPMVAP